MAEGHLFLAFTSDGQDAMCSTRRPRSLGPTAGSTGRSVQGGPILHASAGRRAKDTSNSWRSCGRSEWPPRAEAGCLLHGSRRRGWWRGRPSARSPSTCIRPLVGGGRPPSRWARRRVRGDVAGSVGIATDDQLQRSDHPSETGGVLVWRHRQPDAVVERDVESPRPPFECDTGCLRDYDSPRDYARNTCEYESVIGAEVGGSSGEVFGLARPSRSSTSATIETFPLVCSYTSS